MSDKKLSASYTLKVGALFESKGWELEPEKELKLSLYNKYIDRLKRLPEETRPLFLELTERFERFGLSDISRLFYSAYDNIDDTILENARKIYILPLLVPEIKVKRDKLDKPGKVTHLRRMKLTRVNELPRFDLSVG